MSDTDYCSVADLYAFGLPRGSVPNPARLTAADATTDAFTLGDHGFSTGDRVQFRAEGGGSLPAPLVAGTVYYAIATSDFTFQVSATSGGAAIDFTTAGARTLVIAELPTASAIHYASRLVDDMLPAHVVPLALPIPEMVRITTAEIAAAKLGHFSGAVSKSLADTLDRATKRLERWATGIRVRGMNAPTTHTNDAASGASSLAAPCLDPTGWNRFGGL